VCVVGVWFVQPRLAPSQADLEAGLQCTPGVHAQSGKTSHHHHHTRSGDVKHIPPAMPAKTTPALQ